ncbi:restriction endonuclease subunit S [Sunxiuqinia indica]|uniref:restriction endonuclease subunit S n=1 Tax=Sunxiuqinia indica TaxID=2692584 RepID=UPI001356C40C|nr:restriction endonuclease subunit S [Sunxiuqinia indica]
MNKIEKLIPELRFPAFVKDKDWEKKSLIDTADKKVKWSFTGGPFGSNLKASDYTKSGFRIIQLQNIGDGEFNDDYKIYASKEKADELLSCNIYAGDIIISKMGDPVGRACIIPDSLKRCIMASDGIRLVVDEKLYSKYFIYSLINSNSIRESIEKKSTGSTRKRIGLDELRNINLYIPKSLKEQQKIASCLSSLDELIQVHTKKLEILKDHKKGLMQNLFLQEGEKVPKYRFPEFENKGNWVNDVLGNRGEFMGGGTPSKSNPAFWDGDFPWISSSDISEDSIHQIGITRFITNDAIKNSATKVIPENSLLIVSRVGVGKIAITTKEISTSQDFTNFIPEKDNVEFLGYYLKCKKDILLGFSQGMAIKGFTKDDIASLKLSFPTDIREQQKIASTLSALDNLILAQTEKIEQLKEHKIGLMQSLFPTII